MLEAKIRPSFDRIFIVPVAKGLSHFHRISPNFITYLSGVLGLCVMPSAFWGHPLLAVLFILLSGYCDILDGAFARLTAKTSPKGAMLDICIDRVVEASIILALFLISPETRGLYCLLMLASTLVCVTSFLVAAVLAETSGQKSFYYSPGLMERPEAFIFFVLMFIFPAIFSILAIIYTALVFYTAIMRIGQSG